MKTLYIDTHASDLDIILFDDAKIINEKHIINERNNSALLMPSIEMVCNDQKYDEIIIVNGPGSFTGVRLGVVVAKTLAYTQNIPIKSLTFFDVMKACHQNDKFAFSDKNGFFIQDKEKMFYLNNKDFIKYSDENNITTDVSIDYKKIIEYSKKIDYINPHLVNPIYVKLIGVENDKKSS